jgi:hypothetical protein
LNDEDEFAHVFVGAVELELVGEYHKTAGDSDVRNKYDEI